VWSSRKRLAHDDDAQLARADSNGATLLALPEVRGNFEDAECRRSTIAALVACRTGAGLTQESVAERMGTTQSAVSELEGGATDPRLSTLQRYARSVDSRLFVHVASHHIEGLTDFRVSAVETYKMPQIETWSRFPSVLCHWRGPVSFVLVPPQSENA
jgi:transcriptional regulator with XRE-family HTH domain